MSTGRHVATVAFIPSSCIRNVLVDNGMTLTLRGIRVEATAVLDG